MLGNEKEFSVLKDMILTRIEGKKGDDEIIFHTSDGRKFKLYHMQECCENVTVEDICGDIEDLIGNPLLVAEEVVYEQDVNPEGVPEQEEHQDSFTWTFYKLSTIKGSVTIRWYGASNGYYSETVDLIELGATGCQAVA